MESSLEYVERKLEEKEKDEIKTNIVIRGLETNEEDVKQNIQKITTDMLNINVKIESSKVINTRGNKKLVIA